MESSVESVAMCRFGHLLVLATGVDMVASLAQVTEQRHAVTTQELQVEV